MSQISPPMRILLVVVLAFAAAYMLVLKPKGGEPVTAPTTPVPAAEAGGPEANTALGDAVESARGAAGTAESAGETSTAPGTSTKSSPAQSSPETAPAKPADPADAALAKLPEWLQESMDKKVIAILFTNNKSADDKRTQAALKDAYKGDGEVVARAVPIGQISKYEGVASDLDVQQSPTMLVIARDRTAQALVGYSSLNTINQAIIDGLLATDNPRQKVEWFQLAQQECKQITNRSIVGVSEGESMEGVRRNVAATIATMTASLGTLRNAPIPAQYKSAKGLLTRYIASEISLGRTVQGALTGKVVNPIKLREITRGNDKLASRAQLEMNAHGVSSCN